MTKRKIIKKVAGRPALFSEKLALKVCEKIASGQSLRKIAGDKNMPSITTIWTWLDRPSFAKQYARAREEQADALADEITEISDAIIPRGIDGRIDSGAVNQARLKIDARKWIAAKLKPKKYGDRLELGGDKENPLELTIKYAAEGARAKFDSIINSTKAIK